jgi:hypothetical protein
VGASFERILARPIALPRAPHPDPARTGHAAVTQTVITATIVACGVAHAFASTHCELRGLVKEA